MGQTFECAGCKNVLHIKYKGFDCQTHKQVAEQASADKKKRMQQENEKETEEAPKTD